MSYTLVTPYSILKDSKDIHAVVRRYNAYVDVRCFVLVHTYARAHAHARTYTHTHPQPILFFRKSRNLFITTTVPHYFRMIEKRAMQGEHSTTSWPEETHQFNFCNRV